MGLFDLFRRRPPAASVASPSAGAQREQAERWILRGNADEDAGRHDDALASYEEALRLLPEMARAHLNRGNALFAAAGSTRQLRPIRPPCSTNPAMRARTVTSAMLT
ncbi:MAG: tetratricopeptide repeat protein [Rhodanobacteraceae bacterium]|nr:tetratricopeptide repeat protein [Rhodanobacteraceae bacterium]